MHCSIIKLKFMKSVRLIFLGFIILMLLVCSLAEASNENFLVACTADAGTDISLCLGGRTTLGGLPAASGGTGPYTYLWSPAVGLDDPFIANPAASPKITTTYTLTITDADGCQSTSSVTVTINAPPAANGGSNFEICQGDEVRLGGKPSATGGQPPYSYQWVPTVGLDDPTKANPIASPTVSSYYFLLVEDAFGCQDVDIVWVEVMDPVGLSAGDDQVICSNSNSIPLNGSVANATTIEWTTGGTGYFSPGPDNLDASYIPSTADKALPEITITLTAGNASCNPVQDEVKIFFYPETVVDAGNNATICSENPDFILNGSISGSSTTGYWSTSGTGTFDPDSSNLNAKYIPGPEDLSIGSVTLTLSSINSTVCQDSSDSIIITYQKLTADAGEDQEICVNQTSVPVKGSITGLTDSLFWSTNGTGNFENPNQLITSYIISKNDLERDSVTLLLTHVGMCNTVTDALTITILKLPEISAGTDFTVCSSGSFDLFGTAKGNYAETYWVTSGDGGFSTVYTALEVTYTPGPGDISTGFVDLKLIVNSSFGCDSIEDGVRVSFSEEVLVEAGPDQQICMDTESITLEPVFSAPVDSIKWVSTGNGVFTAHSDPGKAIYFPSEEDLTRSKITLTLQAFSGLCRTLTDSLSLSIEKPYTIDGGPDSIVCRDLEFIQLNAISSHDPIKSGWITNGNGKFISSTNSLSVNYQFDASDFDSDQIYFVIESEGTCNSASDTVLVSFYPEVIINAGNDALVCNDEIIALSGVSSINSIEWSSSGNGLFIPSNTVLNPAYIPDNQDIENGEVRIILSAQSSTCGLFSDTLQISILKNMILDAGDDQFVCTGNEMQVLIEGKSSEPLMETGTLTFWETPGTGTFRSDSSESVNTYMPSAEDLSAGIVSLIFRSVSSYSCRVSADTTYIRFVSPPEVDAGEDFIAVNNEFEIDGFVDTGSFIWASMGSGSFPGGETSLQTRYNASEYDILQGSVTLILSSTLDNCPVVSDSVRINLSESLMIPNAFTPDGDGINDRFLDGIDKVIFNRWGQVIYEGTDGWNGKVRGVNASQGTYFYQIKGEFPAETPHLRGSVTLIRQN